MDFIHGKVVKKRMSGMFFIRGDDKKTYLGHTSETELKIKEGKSLWFTPGGKKTGEEGREGKYQWAENIMTPAEHEKITREENNASG